MSCLQGRATLLAFAFLGGGLAAPQTPWQRNLVKTVARNAEARSTDATPAFLDRLESPALRAQLQKCGALSSVEASALSSSALAARIRREVAVAEIASGFPSSGDYGMTLMEGEHEPFFESNWEAGVRRNQSWNGGRGWFTIQDDVETKIYGMKPFARTGDPQTMAEAAERAPYCIVNLHKHDSGSELYGDITAVFAHKLASVNSVVNAFDTGGWTGMCNLSQEASTRLPPRAGGPPHHWPPPGYSPNCTAYKGFANLGSLRDFDHLFLDNEIYWNTTEGMGSVLCRLLAPWKNPSLLTGPDLIHYWEAMPVVELDYPRAVKFVIASFPKLFGTSNGTRVQEWCKREGWVLIWSLGLNYGEKEMDFFTVAAPDLGLAIPANHRLVDPVVMRRTTAGANLSVSTSAVTLFDGFWSRANASRLAARLENTTVSNRSWARSWHLLEKSLPSSLRLAPLSGDACGDVESCVGTTWDGDCFCYASSRMEVIV